MAGGAIESGRSVASRVAAILMAFRSGGTHSLTELAGLAGLPISTTHRLVGELVTRRVLERTEEGGYRVGLPLRMIGGISLASSPPLLERALDVIADLATVTGTAVRVGVLDGPRLAVAATDSGRTLAEGFISDVTPAHACAGSSPPLGSPGSPSTGTRASDGGRSPCRCSARAGRSWPDSRPPRPTSGPASSRSAARCSWLRAACPASSRRRTRPTNPGSTRKPRPGDGGQPPASSSLTSSGPSLVEYHS
jgi:hypothetical protein